MKKFLWKFVKPFVKAQAIKLIENEEYQKKYVALIAEKIDIPNISKKAEKKLLDQIYDIGQEVAVDMIEEI